MRKQARTADLTPHEIATMLRWQMETDGITSARGWARLKGLPHTDVSDVLKGAESPKKKLREILGIERVVVYRRGGW